MKFKLSVSYGSRERWNIDVPSELLGALGCYDVDYMECVISDDEHSMILTPIAKTPEPEPAPRES